MSSLVKNRNTWRMNATWLPFAKIACFDVSQGGDLRSYLRVIATREQIRVINKGQREAAVADDAFRDMLSLASDPELGYLRACYRADVDAAMPTALTARNTRFAISGTIKPRGSATVVSSVSRGNARDCTRSRAVGCCCFFCATSSWWVLLVSRGTDRTSCRADGWQQCKYS